MNLKKIVVTHWPIVIILIIAALLRLWRLEALTTFGGDQGYDFLIVKQILEGNLTLLGPKIGPYNELGNLYLGPAYYYLLAPFLFLFNLDPIGAAVLTVLLSLGTILVIYYIGSIILSRQAGLLTSLLYAVNPFLIEQSRAPSNPHMIPFFSALATLLLLLIIIKRNKNKMLPILIGMSLGIIFQLHYLAVSLVLASILTIYKRIKLLILTLLGFTLAVSPQILFELRNEFFITNQFINQFNQGRILTDSDSLINGLLTSIRDLSTTLLTVNIYFVFVLLVLVFIAIYYLQKVDYRHSILIIVLPIVINIILVTIYPGSKALHYFSTIYPNIMLLIGISFWIIYLNFKKKMTRILIISLIIVMVAANLQQINLNKIEGYTMPAGWNLTGIKKASKIIANDVDTTKTFNIAATLDGDTRARPYRYLVEVYGKKPLDVEKYPQADTLYLISRDEREEIERYTVWEVASFRPYNINNKWHIQNGINLYKLNKSD